MITPYPRENVLGGALELCSTEPLTGYFRDGACNSCAEDNGSHTVCAVMTDEFWQRPVNAPSGVWVFRSESRRCVVLVRGAFFTSP
jgi:hypothetical protein